MSQGQATELVAAELDVAELDVAELDVAEFDVVGMIRRVRRLADLSQRDLATRLGVAQSVVARWETGEHEPSLRQFATLLALAGLHVEVRDGAGSPVGPMQPSGVRDRGWRRFPAHLDARPMGFLDPERADRGGVQLDVICRRRQGRDERRERSGVVPGDHPSREQVQATLRAYREERARRRHAEFLHRRELLGIVDPPEEPCCCLIECEETIACAPGCPCGCERPDEE